MIAQTTDANAKRILREVMRADSDEQRLREKQLRSLLSVLPARKAVRYMQIENKLRTIQRYDVAERLSLVAAAGVLITDSAGVREAAAALGVTCHDTRYGDPAAIAALRPQPRPRVVGIAATRAGTRVAEIMVENFARVRFSGPA